MTINPITDSYELNLAETNMLRKLDERGAGVIETQKGDITVINRGNTFFASILTAEPLTVQGVTASTAFMNLVNKLREVN